MSKHRVLLTIWLLVAAISLTMISCESAEQHGTNLQTKLIPREVIFGNPTVASPRLSPDGKMLSYRAPVDGVMNVWVGEADKDSMWVVTEDSLRGISRYFWAQDNKHIMYLQDVGGNENFRLYAVDIFTRETRDLTPYDNIQVRIVDVSKHFPNEILISMNKDNPQLHDVYHLDLTSGELKTVAKNPGNVIGWLTDADFKVRGSLMMNDIGGYDFMVRKDEKADWDLAVSWGADDALASGPMGFTKDGKSVYLIDSRNSNAARLEKMNLATKETEVMAEDPQYDVSDVIVNPDTWEIQAVIFTKDRNEIQILDDSIRDDFAAMEAQGHGDMFLSSRDNADDTWIFGFDMDDGPIPFYKFDRATKKATFLFYHRPELNEYELSSMRPFQFQARDGLTIHGYITFPPTGDSMNLPMVLNVHGGPYARDVWGYNPEAQWMANRGYICMQVNYRGSTGYGKEFLNAGNKEWGGKMHDDLIDGVDWAIEKGYADPEKVAIYGGSYGGYAALVGAAFTPDVFCCAVDIVGPSNLLTWITSVPPYWQVMKDIMYERIGNPETEEDLLRSRSPLFKANEIKIPMLIAQGANDPRVPMAESEQIVQALEENGVEHKYMLFEDEGHGFAIPENRIEFYAAAEQFLAKYLGGRYEPYEGEIMESRPGE
jgi:dipeptidyl aminopeptidase/acylaminoacyl peptidase